MILTAQDYIPPRFFRTLFHFNFLHPKAIAAEEMWGNFPDSLRILKL